MIIYSAQRRESDARLSSEKTVSILEHFGVSADEEKIMSGEYKKVDFLIGKEEDIKELTNNMAGFGIEESQTVIIEYDKGYGHFIVKRIPR